MDGLQHGKGSLQYRDGAIYEGNFAEGQRSGFGVLTMPKNFVYKGQWKSDLVHGRGRTDYEDGSYYEGQYEGGFFQGPGVYNLPGKHVYRGHFIKGARNGLGRIEWASGDWYEGPFADDLPQGKGPCFVQQKAGTCTFEKGELVEGVIADAEPIKT